MLSHDPAFWNDTRNASKTSKERETLSRSVAAYDEQVKSLADVEAILELSSDELTGSQGAAAVADEFIGEAEAELAKVDAAIDAIEFERMLSGESDKAGAILTINAGAGGTEACDWAEILLRMYRRWADAQGYANEVVDFTPGDGAGFRSVTVKIGRAHV